VDETAFRPTAGADDALTPSQRRRAQSRDAILAAARTVIGRHGFADAQISLIAREAGLAVGTIYTHFPSRTELFADLYRHAVTREFDILTATVDGSPEDALHRLTTAISTFCDRTLRGGRFALALLVEPVDPRLEEVRLAYRAEFRSLLAGLVERCVDEGSVPDVDTRIAAAAVLGIMTEVLVLPPAVPSSAGEQRALVADVTRTCLAALRADVGRAAPRR
jgi:AcrR family transcriptional regulator